MAFHNFVIFTLNEANPHRTLVVTEPHGYVKFEEVSVFDSRAKFAVEQSANRKVHIRSCYNNKYWAWDRTNNAIKAKGAVPVEDESSVENCTLFRPSLTSNNTVEFCRGTNGRVYSFEPGHVLEWCLSVHRDLPTIANYIDPSSLVKMPKRVAFKGLYNNKFLAPGMIAVDFNLFEETEYGPLKTVYMVCQTNNGDIQVQNLERKKWWTIASNRTSFGVVISTQDNVSDTDTNTLFEVIKKDDNVIVLRHRGTGLFCAPFSGAMGAFKAYSPSVISESHIQVVEPLLSRKVTVHDADFSLDRARIYNQNRDMVLCFSETDSGGSLPIVRTVNLSKEVTETNAWKTSQTVTRGTSFTFTSGIPKLDIELEFKIESQFSEEHEWSNIKEEKRTISESITVTVPPGKKLKVSLMASTASFDLPFSYTQTDRYITNESEVTTVENDGVFSGSNVYNSYVKIEETSL